MLDLKFLRENLDKIKQNCVNRGVSVDLDKLVLFDEDYRNQLKLLEEIRHKQNEVARSMKQPLDKESRDELIERGKQLKKDVESVEATTADLIKKRDEILRQVPNMTHPDVAVGPNETANQVVRTVGEPKKFSFTPLDHLELGRKLDLIDFEAGARVAGQKFYYLKNEAALLELALAQYAVGILLKEGFTPVVTPDMARSSILEGVGFNPRGDETQIYSVENSDLCMIATSEITLGGMLSDTILEEAQLPMKFAGLSHCFRTEAGAAGKESKGLYRVHQFTKVEMFAFVTPEDAEAMHEEFVKLEERLFQGMDIPYRVVDIGTGDLSGPAYRKYDLEAWMPGRGDGGKWGEVTSTSNCTDYQARRLGIRFRRHGEKKPVFVNMINGTAIAVSRAIIAIMENYQNEDGSISIPEVLKPYMHGIEVIRAKS